MATVINNVFKLIGPSDRECHSLSSVILSCHLQPAISAAHMEIRWFKRTRCVCLYQNRQLIEGKGFIGRMSLFTQALDEGHVSLQLRNCSWSDLGDYLCQVISGDRVEELTVTAEMYIDSPTQAHFGSPVYICQSNREWTEEERMLMEGNALLTEYKTDVRSLMNQLAEKYCKLDFLEEQLKNTKPELEGTSKSPGNKDPWKKEVRNTEEKNKEKIIKEKDALLHDTNTKLENTTKQLLTREKDLQERDQELKKKDSQIQETQTQINDMKSRLEQKDKEFNEKLKLLTEKDAQLKNMNQLLCNKDKILKNTVEEMETLGRKASPENPLLQQMMSLLEHLKTELSEENKQLTDLELLISESTQNSATHDRKNSTDGDRPNLSKETSKPVNPLPGPVSELRLVLLGRSGSGKSSAANTILDIGKMSQAGPTASTQQSTSIQAELAGRKVTVVDTPDWFSPGLSLEQLRQDVRVCVSLSSPGPHAFLLVLPAKQFTAEEEGTLERIEMLFGETCWQNTIIIFTVTDELQKKNINKFIQSGNQEVRRLVEKCRNMTYCLNIKESGNDSQVMELLEKIEKMVDGNKERFYSSKIYLETESQITAIETKILKQEEKEKEVHDSLRNIERVIQEHDGVLRQLSDRTTELERKMKKEMDEEKKRELERKLLHEVQRRMEVEEKVKRLKETRDREKRKMEERHQQEMEKIGEVYDKEARMAAERNLTKIILPELQRNLLTSKTKMKEEFNRQMEEKNKELETLKQELSKCKDILGLQREAYQIAVVKIAGQDQDQV